MRDMGFTMSRDGGKTFTPLMRVNQDGWSIQGCPDDGPAMAVDAKGTVHLVWPTVKDEQGVILYATSQNGARVLDARSPADARRPEAVASADRHRPAPAACSWPGTRCATACAARRSRRSADRQSPEILGATTSYPVMAATDAGLVAVWTSGPPDRSTIGVRVIQ